MAWAIYTDGTPLQTWQRLEVLYVCFVVSYDRCELFFLVMLISVFIGLFFYLDQCLRYNSPSFLLFLRFLKFSKLLLGHRRPITIFRLIWFDYLTSKTWIHSLNLVAFPYNHLFMQGTVFIDATEVLLVTS